MMWNWPDRLELVSSFRKLYNFMHEQIARNQINQLRDKNKNVQNQRLISFSSLNKPVLCLSIELLATCQSEGFKLHSKLLAGLRFCARTEAQKTATFHV